MKITKLSRQSVLVEELGGYRVNMIKTREILGELMKMS